jgi:DNA-binding XRE family transcriptional regulator
MSLKNHPDPVKTELEIVRPISEHSRVFVRVEELQGEELLKHLSRLGEIIRNKRIEMGLTQKQVGDSVGRASSYICNIERAFTALGRDDIRHEHSRPPVEIVLGLATTLELDAGATLSAVGYTLVKEEVE